MSPFNKKTNAITSRDLVEAAVAEAAARPKRAGRKTVQYILSDSSEEETKEDSESEISEFSDAESF